MKRGLFVFEPAMVIIFLIAVIAATTVILHAKSLALAQAYGGDAQLITGAYLIGENQIAIPRMLTGSYAITNSIYLLADGAGKKTDDSFPSGCQWLWQTPPSHNIRTEPDVPSLDVVAENFKQLLAQELKAPVAYQFSIAEPFTVTGVPLQTELIPIDVIPTSGLSGSAGFRNERLGFTVSRAYPFAAMYRKLSDGLVQIRACGVAGTTEGNARTLCLNDAITKLNAETPRLISWTLSARSTPGSYNLEAVQEYQLPGCLNKPTTSIQLRFPK